MIIIIPLMLFRMLACIVINKIDIELRKKLYDPEDKASSPKLGPENNNNNIE